MKRIALITGACAVVAGAALPATATPIPAFTATVGAERSVSLHAKGTICTARPCSYQWFVDGRRVGGQSSFVTTMDVGCHVVDLVVNERRFRNPTTPSATASQEVCVTGDEQTLPPVEEPPAEEPPAEEPPAEEPPAEEPPAEEPPAEASRRPPADRAARRRAARRAAARRRPARRRPASRRAARRAAARDRAAGRGDRGRLISRGSRAASRACDRRSQRGPWRASWRPRRARGGRSSCRAGSPRSVRR